ncbi:hypothetical protein KBC55_01950 [Patescibacteria group bacterium]|nr:hypothetical protein [Patescibacteria group bacterium]
MTINVNEILAQLGDVQSLVATLAKQGLPDEFYERVQNDSQFRKKFITWAQKQLNSTGRLVAPDPDHNPFMLSVEEQISRLRRANDEEGWGISEKILQSLEKSAPEWPKGRLAFRSFRIRFGEGVEGITLTFNLHVKHIGSVFKNVNVRGGELISKGGWIYLISGSHTHQPVIEWVTFDLLAHRTHERIKDVQGLESLADELLVFVWLFLEYIEKIDYEENPALFGAGYDFYHHHVTPYIDWKRGTRGRPGTLRIDMKNSARRLSRWWRYSIPALRS